MLHRPTPHKAQGGEKSAFDVADPEGKASDAGTAKTRVHLQAVEGRDVSGSKQHPKMREDPRG